jgi:adenosylcobinamide-phosphate synthase
MKFLALLVALLLEQVRPVRNRSRLYRWFHQYAAGLQEKFDDGQYRHGVIAWLLAAGPLVLVAALVYHALHMIAAPLAWAWSVALLYVTMGFRQFSHYFTDMLKALNNEDPATARRLLSEWSKESAAEFSPTEIARVAIEQGLLASHRFVFGAIAWFVLLGPAGAILYRASEVLAAQWSGRPGSDGEFGRFAARFYFWLDWVPARATALTFAVVGNFEDAVYCWRSQAAAWRTRTHGVILAAGAGALGIRLGDALHQYGSVQFRPELGIGGDADVDAMESTVRLIWRSLVLWMFLVLIVSLAHALG